METVYDHGDLFHGVLSSHKGKKFLSTKVKVKNGRGRVLFDDDKEGGGSYIGWWKDDKFDGRGVRLWANGDRYVGNWELGEESGPGTKKWARDGSSFTGSWVCGFPSSGIMTWPNGDNFEGTFVHKQVGGEGKYFGKGVMHFSPSSPKAPLEGVLEDTTFHGSDGSSHKMGISSRIDSSSDQMGSKLSAQRNQWNEEKKQLEEQIAELTRRNEQLQTDQAHIQNQITSTRETCSQEQLTVTKMEKDIARYKEIVNTMTSLLPADISDFRANRLLGTGSNAAAFEVQYQSNDSSAREMVMKVLFNWENTPRHTLLKQKYMVECVTLSLVPDHPNVIHPLGVMIVSWYQKKNTPKNQ
ncbi:hypothetical protein Pelo_4839 [Pelomyxa schiedti]|nr:hypothetical protein Pelo_4839 [Pelomyxa schiedti]